MVREALFVDQLAGRGSIHGRAARPGRRDSGHSGDDGRSEAAGELLREDVGYREAPALQRLPELFAESLCIGESLPPRGSAEEVERPAGRQAVTHDLERLAWLMERRDVDGEGLVVRLVTEVGVLDAGRDEACPMATGAVSVLGRRDHLRRAINCRDAPAVEALTDE